MGGQPQEQQPTYPVVQNEMQPPQQQNLYFQPQPSQYLPQMNYSQDAPVLQASSSAFYPQAQPVYPQVPQQQFQYPQQPVPTVEPVPIQPAEPRFRRHCEAAKEYLRNLDCYRVGSFLTVFSTLAYFLFTPHAWPWFLLVAALSVGVCGTKIARERFEAPHRQFYIHALWYGAINIFLVLTNLWAGQYPWSVYSLALGGAAVALHALKVFNNNQLKSKLYIHFIIYVAVITIVLVVCSRGYRAKPLIPLIIIAVWSILLTIHARRVRRQEERAAEQQPAELEVVNTIAQAPNTTNEAENAQLVQNQQEVYSSIHQAQQEQRMQQPQVHLFNQPPQSNIYPGTN